MKVTEINEILDKHLKWLRNEKDGKRADLRGANLRGADLRGADLRGADLYGADLCGANLRGADLRGADLYGADLCGANLCGADLYEADLRGADLCGANLCGAEIEDELLRKFFPICCPEYGEFIGWKKASGYIVKLLITEDAKRSSAYGRKCRCSEAKVLAIETLDGKDDGTTRVRSNWDHNFVYEVGEQIIVANFDEDRRNECAPGIHFFITRQEAVDYN